MRSIASALFGVLVAYAASVDEGCESVQEIRSREKVKVCSTFDDEKTFCGMSARSMKLGGQRFTVPCTYDVNLHRCRENYMCNVADSEEMGMSSKSKQMKNNKKKNKKIKKTRAAAPRRRADEPCDDVDTILEERTFLDCFDQLDFGVCNLGYSNKTMADEYYYVPCVWNEMCVEDINCAVLAPFNFTETDMPTPSPTNFPTPAPTESPTALPTRMPTSGPTTAPSSSPSQNPTTVPTVTPTHSPSAKPTTAPSSTPTTTPTTLPTMSPVEPTEFPSMRPTRLPSSPPTQACSKYAWTQDDQNMSGYTKRNGDWVKDGTCCHPDCPICSDNKGICSGQTSLSTGRLLPDEFCCKNNIQSEGNTCDEKGSAPCYFEDEFTPQCDSIKKKKSCKSTAGCNWGGGACFADLSTVDREFEEQCPCIEVDLCTPDSLATAAIITFDEETYMTMVQYENDWNAKYADSDPEDERVPGYQLELLLDGVINPWDLLVWYQFAGCDAGIFSDVTTPPVHICLTKHMVSYKVLFEARFEGFQNGLAKNRLAQQKTSNFIECFENMYENQAESGLELVTWEIDTNNRADNKCFGYDDTKTTLGRPKDANRRAVSYVLEEEWGCPEFKKKKNCGKEDFDGYLMNLRVDDVGTTDDKCMCQLMCQDRDVNEQYIAWTWNAYEGKCICSYSAKRNKRTGVYIGTPRWNNLTGMMNGNKYTIQTL